MFAVAVQADVDVFTREAGRLVVLAGAAAAWTVVLLARMTTFWTVVLLAMMAAA